MKYIHPTSIRRYANAQGKRVSPSFLLWLDKKVEQILVNEIRALGPVTKTLTLESSAKLEGLSK